MQDKAASDKFFFFKNPGTGLGFTDAWQTSTILGELWLAKSSTNN